MRNLRSTVILFICMCMLLGCDTKPENVIENNVRNDIETLKNGITLRNGRIQ